MSSSIDWMLEDGPVYWMSYRAPLVPERRAEYCPHLLRRDPMSQTHDQDHQKLLDIGVPQHALDSAQRAGINGGRIRELLKKLLPVLIEFVTDQVAKGGSGGDTTPPGLAEPKSSPKK